RPFATQPSVEDGVDLNARDAPEVGKDRGEHGAPFGAKCRGPRGLPRGPRASPAHELVDEDPGHRPSGSLAGGAGGGDGAGIGSAGLVCIMGTVARLGGAQSVMATGETAVS